ncbi:MAG: TraR/DksA family transcriptional regulator [Thiobacillaceae bacterium]
MPPLTRDELQTIERKLRERQLVLLEEVHAEVAQRDDQNLVGLLGQDPGDSGDLSLADALADLNIAQLDRQIRELRDIEAAFGRIKQGTFGLCTDCGDAIGFDRLLANPSAGRCMICQQKNEQFFAQDGHPSL